MRKVKVLKLDINLADKDSVTDTVLRFIDNASSNYICAANVHMCMEAFDDANYARIVNSASMTVPDGRPIVWAQKLLGHKAARQVRGSDLMLEICKEAERLQIPIGLYGGSDKAIIGFQNFLRKQYPRLRIACAISPPFRKLSKAEDERYVNEINESGAKILFVGLGCPKQEYWMAEHNEKINCVMIGIGAVFVFFGITKKQAPRIMQRTGTEWIFRLATEPGRLWKRYLKHNPRFVYHFFMQFISVNAFKKNM